MCRHWCLQNPAIAGIPIDFILFAITLLGVALFHHHTLQVAVTGLTVITLFKIFFSPFAAGPGLAGFFASRARMGAARESSRTAAGLRAAVEAFRGEQRSRVAAPCCRTIGRVDSSCW